MMREDAVESPLARAVRLAGGQSALARKATKHALSPGDKLTQAMVWKWLKRPRGRVPTDIWVIPIERAVNGRVTRYELRSDIYPLEEAA